MKRAFVAGFGVELRDAGSDGGFDMINHGTRAAAAVIFDINKLMIGLGRWVSVMIM